MVVEGGNISTVKYYSTRPTSAETDTLAPAVVKAPKFTHISPIVKSLHRLKVQ